MEAAKRSAERVDTVKAVLSKRNTKHSDSSSSDELEKSNVSSSDEAKVPKKSEKKTDVPEERRAQVINQFTISFSLNYDPFCY